MAQSEFREAVATAGTVESLASSAARIVSLGRGGKGLRGVVARVGVAPGVLRVGALDAEELERRLLEMGFVEGAHVEILHEGLIGRDPIGVRLDDMRVALRRREADAVAVRLDDEPVGADRRP